ncbi:MAG: hypothetical protein GY934_04415, partial [Gammaproteobacteria bacterium]|nr:hypothetical protein [Gammaproteobacteria bacterium]
STNGVRVSSSSMSLLNNEIFGNSLDGVRLEGTGTHTVTGGRIYANFGDGIEVTSSANATVSGCEIFGNLGNGLLNSTGNTIDATGNWWGAVDGPGGSGPGSGDEVTGNVTFTGFLTDGTEFSYFNAGANASEGTITAPAVTQGTDSTEWGVSSSTRILYDLERVILDYPVVDAASGFEIFTTYYNLDNTSGIGGNIQSLTDGDDQDVHGGLAIPSLAPTQYRYDLSHSSHDTGNLRLNFIRENGYRAVVSEVWVVERADVTDINSPVSTITSPVPSAQLTGGVVKVAGTSSDSTGSGLLSVEVGVDGGAGITWYPVAQLQADGGWTYNWVLPGDGTYTLYVRGTDRAGNVEVSGAGISVEVNQAPSGQADSISAFDTPADSGGSITLLWGLSIDDGAGDNDVAGYDIERREGIAGYFAVVGSVGAGVGTFVDISTVDGVEYHYRITTVDLAGNRAVPTEYGPVI